MATNPFADQPQTRPAALTPAQNADPSQRQSQGFASLGMGLMSMDDSDDEEDDHPPHSRADGRSPPPPAHPQVQHSPVPLAAPRPSHPTSAAQLTRPQPTLSPEDRRAHTPEMSQLGSPVSPTSPSYSEHGQHQPGPLARRPSTDPHPLKPPMTPIQPVFARPAKTPAIQFSEKQPIMRGQTESVVPARRERTGRGPNGVKGDDFWRRFSMVVREDAAKKPGEKQSRWLVKTQGGTARLSRWVWCIGLAFLLLIVAGSVLGWWISRQNTSDTKVAPTSFGGGEKHSAVVGTTTPPKGTAGSSTIFHVSPTNTVAKRDVFPAPAPTLPVAIVDSAVLKRHRRQHLNRSDLD